MPDFSPKLFCFWNSLTAQPRLASNLRSSNLGFTSTGITGVLHHTFLSVFFVFLVVVGSAGDWTQGTELLGRCPVTWTIAAAFFCFSYFSDREFVLFWFLPGSGLRPQSSNPWRPLRSGHRHLTLCPADPDGVVLAWATLTERPSLKEIVWNLLSLSLWPWTRYITFLNLSFLSHDTDITPSW
jgi:hypothetical protein